MLIFFEFAILLQCCEVYTKIPEHIAYQHMKKYLLYSIIAGFAGRHLAECPPSVRSGFSNLI